jgi:hypothetical protein
MTLGMGLSIRQAMECRVCKRLVDSDDVTDTAIEAALFGAVPLAICPGCGQAVGRQTVAYKRRARAFIQENKK